MKAARFGAVAFISALLLTACGEEKKAEEQAQQPAAEQPAAETAPAATETAPAATETANLPDGERPGELRDWLTQQTAEGFDLPWWRPYLPDPP